MTAPDPATLRAAFGSYMTGVTVVTSTTETGQPIGFTANSFTSVSLDPPLLLVCPGRFLSTYAGFAACTHFAVNVLAADQQDVADTFARDKGDRFAKTPHSRDPLGNPLITGAVAQFSCTTFRISEAGDHAILLGRVQHVAHAAGAGLGYVGGRYFRPGASPTPPAKHPTLLQPCDGA